MGREVLRVVGYQMSVDIREVINKNKIQILFLLKERLRG
jgi:hypothetical protein